MSAAKKGAKPAAKAATKKPPAKVAGPTTNKSPHAKKAAAKKAAANSPARPHAVPRLWALAAFVAASSLARGHVQRWDEPGAGAARVLALRAEGVNAKPADETFHKLLPKPSGFTTWKALADRLAEVVAPRAVYKGACAVSPYAVVIADNEGHAFFDPRGRNPPTAEQLASVDAVGVLDSIKLQPLVEQGKQVYYVADGRGRVNTVRRVNEQRVRSWYEQAHASGAADVPPELILEVPAQVLDGSAAEAQRLGGVLNAKALRRDDSLRDQAHRAARLRKSGYKREEIAVDLGVSVMTVTNLLALQQLAPELSRQLWSGTLPAGCAYVLATQEEAKQLALWSCAQLVAAAKRPQNLRELIAAEARVEELRVVVEGGALDEGTREQQRIDLAKAEAKLELLRAGKIEEAPRPKKLAEIVEASRALDGLEGEAPALVRAALEYARGGGSLDDLLALVRAAKTTIAGPLSVECPVCWVDPGHACAVDDDIDDIDDIDDDVVTEEGQFHRGRIDAVKDIAELGAPAEVRPHGGVV